MADLNKVFLIGRLTHDPILRRTPATGSAVSDLRLATSRVYNTRDGQRKEEKLYIDVTVWNRQAENCCEYLKKGSQIHIEGYLKMESWEDKISGEKRSKIKVEADRVQFLDRKGETGGGGGYSGSGSGSSGGYNDSGYGDEPGGSPEDQDYTAPPVRRPPPPAGRGGNGAGHGGFSSGGPSQRPSAPPPDEGDGPDDDIPF